MSYVRRARNVRRAMSMDILEGRQLLSGNVTATLMPGGVLAIQGDAANNSFTIIQNPTGTSNDLRVLGTAPTILPAPPTLPDVTTVNSVKYTDFALSSITSIQIKMGNGNNTVGVNGVSVPNAINTEFGTGVNTLNAANDTTGQFNVWTTTAAGSDTYNVTNLNAGISAYRGGTGKDSISVTSTAPGNTIGTLNINTPGTGNDVVTVGGYTSTIAGRSGLGQLIITTGDGNDSIGVTGSSMSSMTIAAGNGANVVNVASPSIVNAANITAGNGTNKITFDNSAFGSSKILAGTGANTIDVSGNSITKNLGLSVTAGVVGTPNIQTVTVNNNAIPTGPMTITLGDGPVYYQSPLTGLLPGSSLIANGDNVGTLAKVNVGTNFRTVTLGADNSSNYLTANSLILGVGNNEDNVKVNARVSTSEAITAGLFETYSPIFVPASSFYLGGNASTLLLNVGDNARVATQAATISGTQNATFGNNEGTVSITRPTAGNSTIGIGNRVSNLTISGVDTGLLTPWNETVTIGNQAGVVSMTGAISGSEYLNVLDMALSVGLSTIVGQNESVTGTTSDNFSISGPVGGNQTISTSSNGDTIGVSGSVGGAQTITASGNTNNINVSGNVSGAQTITSPGNGNTMRVSGSVGGAQTITALGDSNSINDTSSQVGSTTLSAGTNASVIANGIISTGDIDVTVSDNANLVEVVGSSSQALNIQGGSGSPSTLYYVGNDQIANGLGLTFLDGYNTVELVNLNVLGGMNVTGGAGVNSVFAMNVAADYGMVNGGSGSTNNYYDLGGNIGYATAGFSGYITA